MFYFKKIISRFPQDRGHRNGRHVGDANDRLQCNQRGRHVAQLRVHNLRREYVQHNNQSHGSHQDWFRLRPKCVHRSGLRVGGANDHRVSNQHGRHVESRCVHSLRRERGRDVHVFCKSF